jgi:hypothetical protein
VKQVPDKCPFCQSSIMTHGGNPFRSEDCGFATYECKTSRDVSWQIDQFIRIGQSDVCRFREVILLTRRLDEANNRIKRLQDWVDNLEQGHSHSGKNDNREWHGSEIGWLVPGQIVYIGEAKLMKMTYE